MANVFGIVGYACNGKSTILSKLSNNDNYKIIDLPKIYKQLAYNNGYKGVTQHFSSVGLSEYRKQSVNAVLKYIDSIEQTDKDIIIDDIFDGIIFDKIIKKFPNIKIISFHSDYEDRLQRLSKRAGINSYEQLVEGLQKRDDMKNYCGIQDILPLAYSTIYNNDSIENIYNKFIEALNKSLIICITGLSGSGKSTIVSYLAKYYNLPIFYFGKNVTEICNNYGYRKSRYLVKDKGIDNYKKIINEELYARIIKFKSSNKQFIIDGIFSLELYEKLKNDNNIYNICIKLNENSRTERLKIRENVNFEIAKQEIMQKDGIKIQCGLLEIMQEADYIYNNNYNIKDIPKHLSLK